ncbi:MAG TPA: sigma-70 family RNA polymerase sigma factor [Planctomycetota bacterium]|nr:sigma-70 family RNA polymerase sigma factor [Planctomycetota bacterium]
MDILHYVVGSEAHRASFPTTHWSRLRAGGDAEREALDALARAYWWPIHAYLRAALRRSPDDAGDLAQDFFLWVAESGFLAKADPERGRFRAFLKTALRNYVSDADRRERAAKRGGAARHVPLAPDEREPPEIEDRASRTPDEALDAAWRAETIRRAIDRTRRELEGSGRELTFAVFRDYFLDPAREVDYGAVAERHGITTVDVSNHLQRAKRLYREQLRAVVMEGVGSAEDLEEELAWLLGGRPR